jgi:hypothetical protein
MFGREKKLYAVHANPGHVTTLLVGATCGGMLLVRATGRGGGSGKAACGHTSVSVAASPGGTFDFTNGPFTQAAFICQANALHASSGVDVHCGENFD